LSQGPKGEGQVTTSIVRLGRECLAQKLLEQEVTDYLEREHYQRCLAHRMHNVLASRKVPGQDQAAVKAMVQAACFVPN
jgi:hypothetical protein